MTKAPAPREDLPNALRILPSLQPNPEISIHSVSFTAILNGGGGETPFMDEPEVPQIGRAHV